MLAVRVALLVPAGPILQTSTDACQATIGARGAYQRQIALEDIVETCAKVSTAGASFQASSPWPDTYSDAFCSAQENRREDRSTSASTRRRASDRAY